MGAPRSDERISVQSAHQLVFKKTCHLRLPRRIGTRCSGDADPEKSPVHEPSVLGLQAEDRVYIVIDRERLEVFRLLA